MRFLRDLFGQPVKDEVSGSQRRVTCLLCDFQARCECIVVPQFYAIGCQPGVVRRPLSVVKEINQHSNFSLG